MTGFYTFPLFLFAIELSTTETRRNDRQNQKSIYIIGNREHRFRYPPAIPPPLFTMHALVSAILTKNKIDRHQLHIEPSKRRWMAQRAFTVQDGLRNSHPALPAKEPHTPKSNTLKCHE